MEGIVQGNENESTTSLELRIQTNNNTPSQNTSIRVEKCL